MPLRLAHNLAALGDVMEVDKYVMGRFPLEKLLSWILKDDRRKADNQRMPQEEAFQVLNPASAQLSGPENLLPEWEKLSMPGRLGMHETLKDSN